MTPTPRWSKSSHSDNGGACVEFAPNLAVYGTVPVRDSKDPDGPTLAFEPTAWQAFVTSVKTGDLTA
ncbi:DUF397 domain-containing protein [Streptomyces sp. NPDC057702]|uniref:DUF397 domain-containing protein n=1 Tax=unclassified Streptomyces TaxID=2593676 RepID=UPI003696F823